MIESRLKLAWLFIILNLFVRCILKFRILAIRALAANAVFLWE